ncbi:hypothetical protein [Bacteroides uniformis]|jgi:hypothetical protein|uniref:hypothetical protein n=1 Tax=Bacteroides uniformis TaxID=820 RepID=UPI0034C49F10
MNYGTRGIRDYIYGKYVEARRKGQGGMFTLTVQGAAEIERRVAELENFEKDKAIRAGLRSGGNLLKTRGKNRLKQRNYKAFVGKSGRLTSAGKRVLAAHNLYNAFQVRVKRRSLGALIGFTGKGHHSHLVDLGTRERPHPITGTSGVMPGSRYWSDTAEQDWREAMNKVMEGIDRAIYRIMLRRD